MCEVSHRPVYFESHGVAPFERKAWLYNGETVMWELRRPLLHLVERRPLKVCDLLKRDLRDWSELSREILGKESVLMSARQVLCTPDGVEDCEAGDPYIRNEHSCSTSALVLLFAWVCLHRRKVSEKERCSALASSLFSRLLPVDEQVKYLAPSPNDAGDLCDAQPVENGVCLCLRTAAGKAAGAHGESCRRSRCCGS